MAGILGLLSFALFIALIVGLIKPSLVIRWSKKPTRLKVLGYWFLSTILITILAVLFIDTSIDSKTVITNANKYIKEGKYSRAITSLKKIEINDSLYNSAQLLLIKADSLNNLSEKEKAKAKELEEKKKKEENELKQKEQLEREIKSINEGVNIADGKTIDELQMDLVIFASWANIIKDADNSDNEEIKKLSKTLKSKVEQVQIKYFPILRGKYAKLIDDKLWENDIDAYANGSGKRYINFTGGIFAANKNKKDFQQQVHEVLKMFRFKQSRYRWYDGEDEYTYYTIYEGKDSELVSFE
ncbi:hypothetical protein [Psychroflexus sp. MBR-150]|jgi:uncharacterized FlaG/YvyC family protein